MKPEQLREIATKVKQIVDNETMFGGSSINWVENYTHKLFAEFQKHQDSRIAKLEAIVANKTAMYERERDLYLGWTKLCAAPVSTTN